MRRGLAPSRARAQALIAGGQVSIDGVVARKAAASVGDAALSVRDADPWVSRGAHKLLHALDHFDMTPAGLALDIGASTGGFTQVLLARGAERVVAIDVGRGQMHASLAADPRVDNRPGVNARMLDAADLPAADWVVCDVSFISATKVLSAPLAAARPGACLVCLVKPQFELEPTRIGKGGIVKDAAARAEACAKLRDWVTTAGWAVLGLTDSPIPGKDGNREFLLAARKD